MIKRIFISISIILGCISCYAVLHFGEKEHLDISGKAIREKWNNARPDYSVLHSGDLIFRHGRGIISNMLMSFSQHETKYSHAGIISIENENVFVYHAIGGEENVSNRLRKDPLNVFCNPASVHSFGIYRLDLDDQQVVAVDSIVKEQYRKGLEFDTKFDLDTDAKMYCSEFIYKTIMKVVNQRNYLSVSTVSGIKYVACDDLYRNPHSTYVYSYNY
jgi:hypothetical protein